MGNYISLPNLTSSAGLVSAQFAHSKRWVLDRVPSYNLQEILIARYSENPNETEPSEYYHIDDITEGPLNQV
jgi:hypothetical protein